MRAKNSFLQFLANSGSYIINLILSFITRTIFIMVLSESYLGVNGLFTNILSVLSLAELGVGAAMVFHLYEPIAKDDRSTIIQLMNLYRKLYTIIALVVAVIGLILLPFLDIFIKDPGDVTNIPLIYLMFLASTICSYLWGYKRAIIDGHQKGYICSLICLLFTTLQFIIQIIVLLLFKNFIIYLSVQITSSILTNVFLARQANKMYPYLKSDRTSLPSAEMKKSIFKKAGAMSIHKLGDVMLNNTDNLLMSAFVGVGAVGVYSNYLLISTSVNTFLSGMLASTTASIGNLNATEDKNKVYDIFKVIFFFTFWIYSYACVSLFTLYNPFIEVWTSGTGRNYLFPTYLVLLFVVNFYINGIRKAILTFRDAMGLYWYDRYKPIFEVIINLIFSIVLTMRFGIIGILWGTFISVMSTCFWVEPLVTYKHGFKQKLIDYFILFAKYTLIMFILGGFIYWLCSLIPVGGLLGVLLKFIIETLIYNTAILLLFCKSKEFQFLYGKIKQLFIQWRNK